MKEIDIAVAGRTYRIVVEPGQETRVQSLAEQVDQIASRLRREHPEGVDRDRLLVLTGLMLADHMSNLRGQRETENQSLQAFHNTLAERLERLAASNA